MIGGIELVCAHHKNEIIEQYIVHVVNAHGDDREARKNKLLQLDTCQRFFSSYATGSYLAAKILQVLDNVGSWRPSEMSRAFDAMECYALNLLDYPWKKEYHVIVTFSGYVKTQLEPYVGDPCHLLQMIGYVRTSDHKLKLERNFPERSSLICAAFDFFLAATECRTIEMIVTTIPQQQQNARDVYRYRRNNASDALHCIETLSCLSSANISKAGANQQADTGTEPVYEKDAALVDRPQPDCVIITERTRQQSYGFPIQTVVPMQAVSTEPDTVQPGNSSTVSSFSTFSKAGPRSPLDAMGTDALVPSTQSHFRKAPDDHLDLLSRSTQPWNKQDQQILDDLMKPRAKAEQVIYDASKADQLAEFLKDLDPRQMTSAETRRVVLSRLEEHSVPVLHSHRSLHVANELQNKPMPILIERGLPPPAAAASAKTSETEMRLCSFCGRLSNIQSRVCVHCQNTMLS